MQGDITLVNYRCFDETQPATFRVGGGATVALVGPNNCGKSAFLRFFYEFRGILGQLAQHAGPQATQAFAGQAQPFGLQGIADLDEVFSNISTGDIRVVFSLVDEVEEVKGHEVPGSITIVVSRAAKTWTIEMRSADGHGLKGQQFPALGAYQSTAGGERNVNLLPFLNFFLQLSNTRYIGPARYVIGASTPYYDIVTGADIINRWTNLKAGSGLAGTRRALQLEGELQRVFGFNSLEIASKDNELLLYANREIYYLQRLGAGLSQFLIVLVNLAAGPTPSLILIDEPELNLHPALQIEFVRMLYSRAPEGIIFATHNIGLARDVADRVYTFRKRPTTPSLVEQHTPEARLSQILGEMSFASLRELGFTLILLVEGPTEVKVFKRFLELYGKHHVVVVPLGGDSMINGSRQDELRELVEIANGTENLRAIIDSERDNQSALPKREHFEFQQVCQTLGIQCHILERRAIENYFPEHAIKEGAGERFAALGPYDPLEKGSRWRKRHNWRIAEAMTATDLAGTDIEQFLRSLP